MKSLSSYERILRTVQGKPVDRVPILSPLFWNPLDGDAIEYEWERNQNYREVKEIVKKHCDFLCRPHSLPLDLFDYRFLLVPANYIEIVEKRQGKGRITVRYRVRTPKGDLYTTEEKKENVHTTWCVEPLLKDKKDVEKILSVPFRFKPFDLEPFFKEKERLGKRGVMQIQISTPLVCTSSLLKFEDFFLWCITERKLVTKLMDVILEREYIKLEYLLKQGVGPIFWFGGSEQATPPMMSSHLFDELVVAYDSVLFDLVHRYGAVVNVHCHGKVGTVIEKFINMGADMLNPVEPPPDGDIDIEEAKRLAQGRITLIGNIEMRDLEFNTPQQIEDKVENAICKGGKKHFMLSPTDYVYTTISDRFRDNIIRFIKAGLKYGKF